MIGKKKSIVQNSTSTYYSNRCPLNLFKETFYHTHVTIVTYIVYQCAYISIQINK